MNKNYLRVPTVFGPETRFEVRANPPAPFRAVHENTFERLKSTLLAERLENVWDAEANSLVRRAANEAAALAWVTPYPLLVFPTLFEEKTAVAARRAELQADIRERSRELLAV
jgi:hypothetical protein